MTLSEAWDLWEGASPDEDGEYHVLGRFGLCTLIRFGGIVTSDLRYMMLDRIPPHNPDEYIWPFNKEGRDERVKFCREQARAARSVASEGCGGSDADRGAADGWPTDESRTPQKAESGD